MGEKETQPQLDWAQLVEDLHNAHDTKRFIQACQTLWGAADETCIPELYSLLKDNDFCVREVAAVPLARLEGVKALPALFEALKRDGLDGHDSDGLSSAIVEVLEAHQAEAAPLLLGMLKETDDETRAYAAWALGFVASQITPELLLDVFHKDTSPGVRANAIGALNAFKGNPRIVDEMTKALQDKDEDVRLSAISALGYQGDARAIAPLKEVLNAHTGRASEVAKYALRQLGVGKHPWRRPLVVIGVTLLFISYLILPIARANIIAHPPRSAVCCSTPADFGHAYEDVIIPTERGLSLHGWLVPSQNGATVVVAHGFGSNRASTLEAGAMLADHGFGVLWIDLLAHGESEGELLTFDGQDVLAAARYLQAQHAFSDGSIGVWGFSLGGLEALQAACQTLAIGGVVADGPMPVVTTDDMPLPETLVDALWVPFDWVQLRALEWQGIRAYSSARQALKDIAPRPVLLITGIQNRGEARVLRGYATGGGRGVSLWEIPEAGHIGGWQARRDEYTEKVLALFSRALVEHKDR